MSWDELLTKARTDLRWKPGKAAAGPRKITRLPPSVSAALSAWASATDEQIAALGALDRDELRATVATVSENWRAVATDKMYDRILERTRAGWGDRQVSSALGTADLYAQATIVALTLRSANAIDDEQFAALTKAWTDVGLPL